MAASTVGVREFRENLSTYLESDSPVTITRNGDTVGMYVPAPRKKIDWAKFNERARKIQEELAARGITEEDIIADLQKSHERDKKERLRA